MTPGNITLMRYALKNYSYLFMMVMLIVAASLKSVAQKKVYFIDAKKAEVVKPVVLKALGGTGPDGKIEVNNNYISKNGIPIIPITGEMHFSRYPNQYWDESVKKMKAGGINIIATYVFWNIHEEKEGKFDWSGDRDLRKFVEICAKNKMAVIVRVGPFDHGEIRNGGIPDWLLNKPLTIRTNDPGYLHYVEILYNQIGKQLKGLFYKDGGPIIGVQLENEMQHSASPWGITYPGQPYDLTVADQDRSTAHEGVSVASGKNEFAESGNQHMRTLKELAIKAGLIAPIYTATGWGYAALIPNETLPVTAAYAYPTWVAKKEHSPFYLYKDLHHHPDYAPVRYQPADYPVFAAELGSGIMATYSRRPLVPAESLDALINRCIGSGANGIGYYMYHGGSTPVGDHYFFNDEAFGYPKISYDFQAPIGEYGQVRPSFHRLKLLHFFINDFAEILAPMATVLPENNKNINAENTSDLRYAIRSDGNSGFLFINNFQDNDTTSNKTGLRFDIATRRGQVKLPEHGGFTLNSGENLVLPFNIDLNGNLLNYATAQLLTGENHGDVPYYVFFNTKGLNPEFCFAGNGTSIKPLANCRVSRHSGKLFVNCNTDKPAHFILSGKKGKTHILVINKQLALDAYQLVINGSRHLVFSQSLILETGLEAEIFTEGQNNYKLSIFPKLKSIPKIDIGTLAEKPGYPLMSNYSVSMPEIDIKPDILKTGTRKVLVNIPQNIPHGLNDIFLNIDYIGDTGMAFLNGELVADEFYKGIPWEIGLKRFSQEHNDHEMGFYFRPMMNNATYLIDLPDSVARLARSEKQTLKINSVTFKPEYKSIISFK